MSETPAPPSASRSPTGRWRLILLLIGAMALVVGAWVAYEVHQARQIWPADMPELEMPPPVIAPHPEALARLDALIAAAESLDAEHEARSALLDAEEPPAAPLDGWPPDDAPTHAALDAFLATGGLVLPLFALEAPPEREFMPLLRASALRRVRALRRFVEHDPGGAWRDVADVWSLGERLSHSGSNLLVTVIGMALEEQALSTAERLLAAGPWHPGAGVLAERLAAATDHPSPMIAALTGECLSMDGLFTRMGQADAELISADGIPGGGLIEPAAPGITRADDTWLFDSEKTRAFARRQCLIAIEAARTPAPQRQAPPEINIGVDSTWSVGAMLDNPVGRTLLSVVQVSFGRYVTRADRLAYRRHGVRIALARSAYAAATGRAPDSADQLVPTHLARWPDDPLTGESMALEPPPLPELD